MNRRSQRHYGGKTEVNTSTSTVQMTGAIVRSARVYSQGPVFVVTCFLHPLISTCKWYPRSGLGWTGLEGSVSTTTPRVSSPPCATVSRLLQVRVFRWGNSPIQRPLVVVFMYNMETVDSGSSGRIF